jgi:hypothetical protein
MFVDVDFVGKVLYLLVLHRLWYRPQLMGHLRLRRNWMEMVNGTETVSAILTDRVFHSHSLLYHNRPPDQEPAFPVPPHRHKPDHPTVNIVTVSREVRLTTPNNPLRHHLQLQVPFLYPRHPRSILRPLSGTHYSDPKADDCQ